MSKIVRSHNSNSIVIKGIGQTGYITLGNSFIGIADPLSEDNNYVNKPACSIPSLFARMIFFKMAFEPGNYTNRNNVYDTFVSQCLDLLEMIFNNDPSITIRQFKFTDQINALRNDGIDAHKNFAEILAEQQQKYMPNVGSIFLFEQNGKIIGGTSPYTLVYTSPNWNSGKPVTPLIQRNELFQKYLFDLHDVCSNAGLFNQDNNSFFDYIGKVMQNRGLRTNMNIGIADLNNMYSPVTYSDNGNQVNVVVDGSMFLHSAPRDQFDSDLFVESRYSFDRETTPIVLSSNIPAGLNYYNNVRWNPNFTVQNVSDGPLPGNCPPHPNLRIVDLFEDKLFALPYPIDEVKYGKSIEISDGNGNSQYYSALLPLKPAVLTYFKKENIKDPNFLSIIKNTDGNSITIQLNIPIRNADGTRRNQIQLSKTYNLTTDVEYVYKKETDNAFNVGISPFVKSISKVALNKYCVMMVLDEPSALKNPDLSFYKFGEPVPMVLPQGASAQRSGENGGRKTWYVTVDDFDFIRVKLTDASDTDFYALIVPDFVDVNDSPNIYGFYGVDFGTTNTHIAFFDNQDGDTKSFSSIDFQCQVAYLNKLSRSLTGGSDNVVDKFRVLKAREFFPIASDNQYGFPFRTALYSEKATNQDSKVFKEASIGFHYEKEYVPNPSYVTSLKWDLINGGNNSAIGNGNVFFVELMHVVRNHWLNQNVDHNSLPRIMFTYPLNQCTNSFMQCCSSAYYRVFGQDPGTNIRWMTESLAPCQHKIFTGQNVTTGLLNVDIGGGTTDIQYYLQNGNTELSFYDSVLFAGDDLWGQAYENMGPVYAKQNRPDNNFTALARGKFDGDLVINVKGNESTTKLESIKLGGKEFVNYLFRDANNMFSNLLSNPNADTDKCRLQMFLHYSAIVFHITNLLKQNGLQVPASISFSGLGSKYLKLLFPVPGYEEQYLKDFTKALINKYYPQANIPTAFSIELRERPKDATAEGAALSFQKIIVGNNPLVNPQLMTITGFDREVLMSDITEDDCKNAIKSLILEFLDGFRSVDANPNNKLYIPIMTDDVYEKLKNDCIGSYAQIANGKYNQSTNKNVPLNESAFIWTLKDSIWKI